MIGDRLDRIARRVLSDETYAAVAAPAIADLQFEAHKGWAAQFRSYVAVWSALALGAAEDVAGDTLVASRALRTRKAIVSGAVTALIFFAVFAISTLWNFGELAGPKAILFVLLLPSLLPLTFGPALMMAVRDAAGQWWAVRGYAIAGLIVTGGAFLFVDQAVTRTNYSFRRIEGHARGIADVRKGSREMSVVELLRGDSEDAFAYYSRRYQLVREAHTRMSFAASCLAYALFGVRLATKRLRIAIFALLGICIGHAALISLASYQPRGSLVLASLLPWIPSVILVLVAFVALRRHRSKPANLEPTN